MLETVPVSGRLAALALAFVLPLAAACSRSTEPTPAPATPAGAADTTAPSAGASQTAVPEPAVGDTAARADVSGTLLRLDEGDRACYVVVQTAAGEQSLEGDFELCPGGLDDASRLVGQRVTWSTRRASVLAASCEGDPDCGQSDEVDLVVKIEPAA